MRFTRRRFLVLGGLSGLGLALLGRELGQSSTRSDIPLPEPRLELPKDKLIFRFAATADSGAGDRNQFAIGQAMADYHAKNPYDLVVMAGDNIYNSGEISRIGVTFEQPYAELLKRNVKFRACLGNHDIRTDNGDPQVKYPGFNMDDRTYTYKAENCQFFVLDTNVTDWKSQLAWLEQQLKESQAKIKVVYGHHPIYASGHYGTNPEMVKRLSPIFKQYGVQLYINGHEHHYERTAPIEGTTYLITGHGGASLRKVGKSKFTEFSVSRHGFSSVEIRQNGLVIQGFDKAGNVFDRGIVPIG
jgi:3',5'-cyclic AMP phosphodiesterase CpdA